MNVIRREYRVMGQFLNKKIKRIFIICFAMFMVLVGVMYYLMIANPQITIVLYQQIVEMMKQKDLLNDTGVALSGGLFVNNLISVTFAVLLGFMPFLFLPVWVLIVNASIMPVVFSAYTLFSEIPLWKAIVFGILPHGIFELPALFLGISLGIYICKTLCMIICKSNSGIHLKEELKNLFRTYVLLILPLLVVAALIEGLITPMLLNMVM